MALLFMDGFDKYGPANSNSTGVAALLTAGEWNNTTGTALQITASLSVTGTSLSFFSQNNSIAKTLATSYGRLIGGFRFNSNLGGFAGIQFSDGGTAQASVAVTAGGVFVVRNGALGSGTILGTSTASVTASSTHYLEFDITFGNSGSYQLWLDGVSILGPATGDTTGSTNNTANTITLVTGTGGTWAFAVDDFYLFDSTGSANNAVLLTSPRVETTFPTSDGTVQFGFGAGILGSSVSRNTSPSTVIAGSLYLRRFTPAIACTLNSISVQLGTNAAANLRPVIYSDSAGVAGALLSAGSTVVGITAGVPLTLALTTPQSLVAGTSYWLGFMNDVAVNSSPPIDSTLLFSRAAVTFASGAPSTAPAMAGGSSTWLLWGNITGAVGNYDQVNNQPPDGIYSYVLDATVGHEDLYNFAPLSVPPAQVYAVAVKAYAAKSDAGTKTVSMRVKSGATDSGGSSTGQAMGTSFGWLTSLFPTDPNGGIPWTGAAVNAAQAGFRVDS